MRSNEHEHVGCRQISSEQAPYPPALTLYGDAGCKENPEVGVLLPRSRSMAPLRSLGRVDGWAAEDEQ